RGRARPDQCAGDSAPVDLRQVARSGRVGEDALQLARPGRPLVPGRECREGGEVEARPEPKPESLCRAHSRPAARSARAAVRETRSAAEPKLSRWQPLLLIFLLVVLLIGRFVAGL